MERKFFVYLIVLAAFLLSAAGSHALDINGWWRAKMPMEQGDFVTAEWITLNGTGKRVSYFYIYGASENTLSSGPTASLFIWDDEANDYICEQYYVYMRNNSVALVLPTQADPDNNQLWWGSTIILRVYGTPNRATSMEGHYTLFDWENAGSTDQFVRMGPVHATPVDPNKVPDPAKNHVCLVP